MNPQRFANTKGNILKGLNNDELIPSPEKIKRRRINNHIVVLHFLLAIVGIGLALDLGITNLCSADGTDCLSRTGAFLVFISVSAAFINYHVQSEEKVASNILFGMGELPNTPSDLAQMRDFSEQNFSEEDAKRMISSMHFSEAFYRSRVSILRIFGQDLLGFETLAVAIGTLVWGFGDIDGFRYVAYLILVCLYARVCCLCWGLCNPSEDTTSRL